jgi:hypothetical protein
MLYINHNGFCGSRKMCLSYSVRLVEQPIGASLTRVVSTSHVNCLKLLYGMTSLARLRNEEFSVLNIPRNI